MVVREPVFVETIPSPSPNFIAFIAQWCYVLQSHKQPVG